VLPGGPFLSHTPALMSMSDIAPHYRAERIRAAHAAYFARLSTFGSRESCAATST